MWVVTQAFRDALTLRLGEGEKVKTNNKLLRSLFPVAASLALAAGSAQAASISYLLDQSNALPDGTNYLQVTVADGMDGAIDFTVEVLGPLSSIADGNFGMTSFAFNVIAGGFAEAGDITGLPDGWRARNGKRMDGFGLFDIKLQGRGWARTDSLTFSITGIDGDTVEDYAGLSHGNARQGHQFFAAHVAGFEYGECDDGGCGDDDDASPNGGDRLMALGKGGHGGWKPNMLPLMLRDWKNNWDEHYENGWEDDCIDSAFFGGSTAVPLPAPAWLLGAGVVGVFARARRRRS